MRPVRPWVFLCKCLGKIILCKQSVPIEKPLHSIEKPICFYYEANILISKASYVLMPIFKIQNKISPPLAHDVT